jgi:hypothetical protein
MQFQKQRRFCQVDWCRKITAPHFATYYLILRSSLHLGSRKDRSSQPLRRMRSGTNRIVYKGCWIRLPAKSLKFAVRELLSDVTQPLPLLISSAD